MVGLVVGFCSDKNSSVRSINRSNQPRRPTAEVVVLAGMLQAGAAVGGRGATSESIERGPVRRSGGGCLVGWSVVGGFVVAVVSSPGALTSMRLTSTRANVGAAFAVSCVVVVGVVWAIERETETRSWPGRERRGAHLQQNNRKRQRWLALALGGGSAAEVHACMKWVTFVCVGAGPGPPPAQPCLNRRRGGCRRWETGPDKWVSYM